MELVLSWEDPCCGRYPATAPDRARYFLNRRRPAAAAPMPSRLTPRIASDAGSGMGGGVTPVCEKSLRIAEMFVPVPPNTRPSLTTERDVVPANVVVTSVMLGIEATKLILFPRLSETVATEPAPKTAPVICSEASVIGTVDATLK